VLEEYFAGHDRERLHDLRSGSKTFASVLAGAARLHGAPIELDAPVARRFARYQPLANPDLRKNRITLRHLMTMSTGLACDENDNDSPGSEGRMQGQAAQPDWYRFALDLPMAAAPGERYAYCSAGVNLVGGVIGSATGEWLPSLFDRLVARPLQIRRYAMNLTPTGEGYFGGGMRMRPRDYLKFGQLYLDGGRWNGRRVVSRAWVDESTRRQIEAGNGSADGLNWHLYTLASGGRAWREYEANGNGGQLLVVLPELDLVVVFTAGNYNSYGVWRKFRDEWVPQAIIPAVTGP
jgi:CubicO group peptidase (beta-lactamase class C family)